MAAANKRANNGSPGDERASKQRPSSTILGISRSIAACQRCREKKVKCDQNFPKCSRCQKSNSDCVGIDSATGRQVPRSYIVHLEDRIAMLESKLLSRGIDPDSKEEPIKQILVKNESSLPMATVESSQDEPKSSIMAKVSSATTDSSSKAPQSYLGDSSLGISFAKLMLTAMKYQQAQLKPSSSYQPIIDSSNLKASPQVVQPSLLPPKDQAESFLYVYFAQSNAQLPVVHREQFIMKYFQPIYGSISKSISLASNYTSINKEILTEDIDVKKTWFYQFERQINSGKSDSDIVVPIEFHKPLFFMNIIFAIGSSIHHLEYPAQTSEGFRKLALKYVELVYGSMDRLESLQGILLLATYSIMRPSVPGVWYTLGSVLRACVDLGLHTEMSFNSKDPIKDPFITDMRRRLFWCAYSLDRQVCFYLGRPFGIPEESINARFPSELDDALIVENNLQVVDYSEKASAFPSYKVVSIAMFKIRKLQLEVQKILYGNGELPRVYKDLQEWKVDINKRLNNWKLSSPKTQRKMNCDFNLIFFNLNYNHTRLILHGLSPRNLKLTVTDYLTVADSSKEVIKCYKTLLELKRINYTWVAVHNLFMAGTSYLYSIYHCLEVSNQTSLEQIKLYSSDCILILNSLIDRCDAASHCRDTFEILSAAVIRLKYDAVFKVPGGGTTRDKISMPEDQQLGNQHLSQLIRKLDDEKQQVKEELTDLKLPAQVIRNEQPSYQQQYNNSLIEGQQQGNNSTNVTDEWVSNSYDLDKFFQELETMGPFSPTNSSRSNSNSNNQHGQDNNFSGDTTPADDAKNNLLQSDNPLSTQFYISNNNNSNDVPNKRLPSTREGQRIYNMIYQIPDEPIWEQFFNTTSSQQQQQP